MIAALLLPGMGGVVAVLLLLGLMSAWLPARAIPPATMVLCLLGVLVALAVLATGTHALQGLPLGLGFLHGSIALDPLAAVFVLPICLAGASAASANWGQAASPLLPLLIAAALLTVLAGDAALVVLGMGLVIAIGWAALPDPAPYGRGAVVGMFLLAGVFAVLAVGGHVSFTAMRLAPPDGIHALACLILAAVSVCPLVGLSPLHRSFLHLAETAPSPLAIPVLAAVPNVGLYVLFRILLDLCGPATPGWWGAPLVVLGAVSAASGAAAAFRAISLRGVMAGMTVQNAGWVIAGLGVAMVARGSDLLPVATLALGGAMLHVVTYGVFGCLAVLCTEAAVAGGGSRALDRLGGLARSMPVVSLGMAVAALSLAALPLSAGFASVWTVLQAVFTAQRVAGLGLQLVLLVATVGLAVSVGFGAAATLRLGGSVFLGRPRTPRAAAADDAGPALRITILCLAGLGVLIGLVPGLVLRLLGQAQAMATAAGLDGQAGWASIQTQQDAPGYGPLVILLLVGLVIVLAAILLRAGRLRSDQRVAMWEDGFAAPPAWLPFGDPVTQLNATAVTAALRTQFASLPPLPHLQIRLDAPWPVWGFRHGLAVVLLLVVMTLLAVIFVGPA